MNTSETSLQPTTQPLSKKHHRQQKKKNVPSPSTKIPSSPTNSSSKPPLSLTPPNNPQKNLTPSPPTTTPTHPMRKILVASLGNPPPHASTLHSAGHILLHRLRLSLSYPPFSKTPLLSNAFVSHPPSSSSSSTPIQPYTLWQSPCNMNISGKALLKSWRAYLNTLGSLREGEEEEEGENERENARLVILHDELELNAGKIRVVKGWKKSARGHNGVRSCIEAFGGAKEREMENRVLRIGIGIGRPVGRGKEVVSEYVLRGIGAREREGVEGCVEEVRRVLRQEAEG
ncbi:MAG: hypothetical protein M1812_002292 [Candelaria pacifica]|nr:MAG: hypothetical protein M1812_002292 [Candelaria pacifica]